MPHWTNDATTATRAHGYWQGTLWTLRRWFCLHIRWTRLGYAEYGTGQGPLIVIQCDRCQLVREVPE